LSLRHRLGAIAYDWPRFLRHIGGDWKLIRNRAETVTSDGRGVRCHWEFGSDLHIAKVYPLSARWLMRRVLAACPVSFRDEPTPIAAAPRVSFLIGHRGLERLPQLLATLRSLAAQRDVTIECIVVEQSARREIESKVPSWVRYIHTPVDLAQEYCRAATFNTGARLARGEVLILHDNDMVVPEHYGAHVVALATEGWKFMDLKRFIFYLNEEDTRAMLAGQPLQKGFAATVVQNLHGGSIAVTTKAFFEVGGFDEDFVGWGGEDLEFWQRAGEYGDAYAFGFLPFVHLWHPAQKGKEHRDTPAMRRLSESLRTPAAERIKRLRAQQPPRP